MATAKSPDRLTNLRLKATAAVWLLGFPVLWPSPFSLGWPAWLLAGATLWQVPMAMRLLPGEPRRALWWDLQPFAGFGVLMSFLLPDGLGAGLCTLPWLAMCASLVTRPPTLWATDRLAGAAWVYLVVGAMGTTAQRFGLEILGFEPAWMLMIGVHFHFAGFVLLALLHRLRPARWLAGAAVGGVTAVALGIIISRHAPAGALRHAAEIAESLSAAVLACVGLATAWLQARLAWREWRGVARALMLLSSLALLVSMPLGLLHGLRATGWVDWLSMPLMWATHGSLNGLIALPAALLAWRIATAPEKKN